MSETSAIAWRWLRPGPMAWEQWATLERRCAPTAATASLPWVRAWSEAYADLVTPRVGLALRDGVPLGAVLVADGHRRRGGLRVRSVHLGTTGEPAPHGIEAPYGRLLVAERDRPALAAALVAELEHDRRWDLLRIERLHPLDAAALLRAAPAWRGLAEPSPSIALGPFDADQRLLALPSRTRRQIRRAVRAHGPFTVEVADDRGAGHAVLDELIRLHEARFRPGAFGDPRFVRFHRRLVDELLPSGRLLAVRVRGATGTLGCVTILRDGSRALSYCGGIAAPRGPYDKPGFLVHLAASEACADRGLDEYDLLTGAAPYKRELGRTTRTQWTLTRERRRPRVIVGTAGRRLIHARRAPSIVARGRR